jgi:Secretion system C-terminal sorting domain
MIKNYISTFLLCISTVFVSLAQVNITPHQLLTAPYVLLQWDSSSAAATYPPNSMFFTTSSINDTAVFASDAVWNCPYNFTQRSRVMGKNANGFSFRRTGAVFSDACDTATATNPPTIRKFPGAFVVAINSINCTGVTVNWTGRMFGTSATNMNFGPGGQNSTRNYVIKLQYSIGASGVWNDVPNSVFTALRTDTVNAFRPNGSSLNLPDAVLPTSCDNQPVVLVRWLYTQIGAGSGARAELAVDNIEIFPQFTTSLTSLKTENKISFFPNPANNKLFLSAAADVKIMNALAQTVIKETKTKEINISILPKGIYFVSINNKEFQKLIVE